MTPLLLVQIIPLFSLNKLSNFLVPPLYSWQYYGNEDGLPDNRQVVHRLIRDLKRVGFDVHSDKTTSRALGSHVIREAEKISTVTDNSVDYVILCCSPALRAKYEGEKGAIVKEELDLLMVRKKQYPNSIIPLILSGNIENAVPPFMGNSRVMGYISEDYYGTFFQVVEKLSEHYSQEYRDNLRMVSKLFKKKKDELEREGLSENDVILLREKRSLLDDERSLEKVFLERMLENNVLKKRKQVEEKVKWSGNGVRSVIESNLPLLVNYYQERVDVEREIGEFLRNGGGRHLVVSGISGSGKSQLVIKACKDYLQEHGGIVWRIDGSSPDILDMSYRNMGGSV